MNLVKCLEKTSRSRRTNKQIPQAICLISSELTIVECKQNKLCYIIIWFVTWKVRNVWMNEIRHHIRNHNNEDDNDFVDTSCLTSESWEFR